eukprot:COSAG03_NODE_8219_length_825_cov_0.924242_2_plen_128_part_01
MPPKRFGSPSPRRHDSGEHALASVDSVDAAAVAVTAPTAVGEPAAPVLTVVAAPVATGLLQEIVLQLRLALPATLTYLFGRSLVSIALVFIGRMGDLELGAAALANTTSNVSGLSIIVGMGTAVSTIC